MTSSPQTLIERRHDQMFPTLDPIEIERVRHLGETQTFAAGETLLAAGQVGPGLMILFSGRVDITHREASGSVQTIVSHGPGEFIGELAQLAGRPALVDATAREPVEALVIEPEPAARPDYRRGRTRRTDHAGTDPETSRSYGNPAGPIIVGHGRQRRRAATADFPPPERPPPTILDPTADPDAKALIERFHVDPGQCRSSFVRGRVAAQSERIRARPLHRTRGPDRPPHLRRGSRWRGTRGIATAVYAASEGLSMLVLDCRASGGQAEHRRESKIILAFRPGSPAWR